MNTLALDVNSSLHTFFKGLVNLVITKSGKTVPDNVNGQVDVLIRQATDEMAQIYAEELTEKEYQHLHKILELNCSPEAQSIFQKTYVLQTTTMIDLLENVNDLFICNKLGSLTY